MENSTPFGNSNLRQVFFTEFCSMFLRQSARGLYFVLLLMILCVLPGPLSAAADPPSTSFSNGTITARLYLPSAEQGYYRGTRFDWAGVIYSLSFDGHEFFGDWLGADDPYMHARITGPVDEFLTDGKGLGYDEAPAGGAFIRIGVGVCEKPEEEDYRQMHTYTVIDHGKRSMQRGENWIEFTHEIEEPVSGYAYHYTKRLTLTVGKPELAIDYTLRNTGDKVIESQVYNHNFFVIDGQTTGPDFVLRFPFDLEVDGDLGGLARVRGNELVFLKEFSPDDGIFTLLKGFGDGIEDNRFELENRSTGAGVRMIADRPIARIQFWAPHSTICPEPFIDLDVPPGMSEKWALRYEFYSLQ